ncbi:MAG: transcription termination/antitermination protein NusA [Erysipelotrichia bacterium]|nr:transcription termination/antitermination protein NusA [Erysipelotrichia bacterium]
MAINAKDFLSALEEIEASKGISKDAVLQMLEDSLIRAFRKQLGGDDAAVKVNIDLEKGAIDMYQIKEVVDEVEDDFLQISVTDANIRDANRKYQAGEEFHIPASIDDLRKATALSVKSMLKQKFAEAEKNILYETFKDKIGTIITGKVEKVDERGISVNIIKTSVYLPRKELIGDEKFVVGETIKIYVDDVAGGTKGAHIVVSRSKEGFLRCLFTEEIHEIYDGTIEIKAIAREAGERSKVAVYSHNPNVDPAGACIGPNGSRIQKIVAQLGNGGINKEKIDIIGYSENPALYILEALKPARALGIVLDTDEKRATTIVKDDSLSLAIGRRGVNVRLAVRLTGYNIDIITESDALESGLVYQTYEDVVAEESERLATVKAQLTSETEEVINVLTGLPEGYIAPQDRIYKETMSSVESELEDSLDYGTAARGEGPYDVPATEKETVIETKTDDEVQVAEIQKDEPVAEKAEAVEELKEVKIATSLEELEKSLEEEAVKAAAPVRKRSSRRNVNKFDASEDSEAATPVVSQKVEKMSIYTEEELRAIEEEEKAEEVYVEDNIDYDEFDKYYDEDIR